MRPATARPILLGLTAALALAVLPPRGHAAPRDMRLPDTLSTPDDRSARRATVARICAPELDRFCPELADSPAETANQVICLRPYRLSLSISCRHAIANK